MRLKIALRNLLISQLIIILFLIFAYYTWFPYSYSLLGGFYKTALILMLVDIILGPLLVFIVYNKDKKNLSFDINVLLSIQLAAFIYGAYTLYLIHPAYNIFINDRFKLVNVSYLSSGKVNYKSLETSFFTQPIMAYSELPIDKAEQTRFMLGVDLLGEPDIEERVDLYQPTSQALYKILEKQINPSLIFNTSEAKLKLRVFIEMNGKDVSDYAFYPISGNNKKEAIFVIHKDNAKPVGIINITPPHNRIKL